MYLETATSKAAAKGTSPVEAPQRPRSVLEALVAGRAYLVAHPDRWSQDGSYGLGGDNVCASGAIGHEVSSGFASIAYPFEEQERALWYEAEARLDDAVGRLNDDCYHEGVIGYNDCSATTYEEVLALFDSAIAWEQ